MMPLLTCICALTIVASSSVSAISTKASTQPADKKEELLTVFLTGNELGELQPCGCSGGQLGGFDRRSAILNSVKPEKRLIVDTGLLVEGDSEQDLIKFNIVIEAFHLLDYDLVNLTKKDIEIAQNLGLLNNPVVGFISACGSSEKISAKFSKRYLLQGEFVAVSVAAFDAASGPIEQIKEIFPTDVRQQTVNILILNQCNDDIIASIAKTGIVDCLVCPAESDEPGVISDPNKRPLIVSAGRFGKYVGRLQIRADKPAGELKFSFSALPVTEDLPRASFLVELYKSYQQLVKEANLFEEMPRFSLPNGLEYVSSKSCNLCHESEYEKWSGNPHANAYETLEKAGSQFDPECIRCHVVGAEYESGFISEEQSEHLKNVGCESCHGPGSEHIRTLGKAETVEPRLDCIDCHTPERSADYAGNEFSFLRKIIHWTEPNASSNVKK